MTKLILGIIFLPLFYGVAFGGTLTGRIILENGNPLAKTKIAIEGRDVITNDFGGYRVEIPDGERELNVKIGDSPYTSEMIKIFSPETKQNWRINTKDSRLIRIK